jgi:hypothetical protein
MGDRPESTSRVHMSEDKVCREDSCWYVRANYVLEKLPNVSGPGLMEAGCYTTLVPIHTYQLVLKLSLSR